jgi:protein phosphatase
LRIRAPLKIFGSIHGKYRDLLKIFDSYGIPTEDDIERFDYLFLGNLVGILFYRKLGFDNYNF